ncbi:multicopper oxidase family protein [Saccharothrix sp. ST-888]|uniref:multicopper oxidase family protein n=1 Tax=Saccharothrix sp. ST-888 TaxID=1427391 RepID=UPI0005EC5FEE|nr:multicopper oxidase domain-containing protein [Saccharothrix sp. ST-888]KJK55250.1 bilirubin oxidase [Saccharothrix sp. ST-888]
MLSRRNALKAGVTTGMVGGAGLLVPYLPHAAADTSGTADAGTPGPTATGTVPPAVIPQFAVPLTVPPVLSPTSTSATTDYYTVTMQKAYTTIVPGTKTEVYTYNGSFPGPTIKARFQRRVVVKQINNLGTPVSVHLHGGNVPQDSDGSPMNLIAPGGARNYTYPNDQDNATLWIHDHAHHMESENVYRGLTSLYLLCDDLERSLPLPGGEYDVPLILRDGRFGANGQLIYELDDHLLRNTILVNGRPWPYFQVAARKYRFRILNGSNSRIFSLALSDGTSFVQIGSDGGLLEKPNATANLMLSPGERADVVIDFSRYPIGTRLVLTNPGMPGPPEIGQVLRFDVTRTAPDPSEVPDRLGELAAPQLATVNRSFVLRMDEDGRPNAAAYINDKTYDANRIDTQIAWGTTEVWTVSNANQYAPHNFHLHQVQFRVLERNGKAPDPSEGGLKDTVRLFPGEAVKLLITFDSYEGVYPYHCHLFDHGAMGMMGNMQIS